jgi:putative transposase
MPRKPRFYLPEIPAHVVQRGNCRQGVFFDAADYTAYLHWLKEGAARHGCSIHAYVLMTNHVHLLMTPHTPESISRTIQYVGRHYVSYVNHTYGKSGTLWEGRHKGCVIASEDYLLACMRYIELNPVRAGMVARPIEYHWSSYGSNAAGHPDGVITPHDLYQALGNHIHARQHAYRELFRNTLDREQVHDIRATVQTGTPLGNDRFRKHIERTLECTVGHARRGRPNRTTNKGY